jgi:1,4-alpha-glucan branching enzyme
VAADQPGPPPGPHHPAVLRALDAVLFQGAEWNSRRPFFYFAHHQPELAALVRKGRAEFLSQFTSCNSPEAQEGLPDPGDPGSFEASRLDWDERERPEQRGRWRCTGI